MFSRIPCTRCRQSCVACGAVAELLPERARVGYPSDECYRQTIVNEVVPREMLMATCEEMAKMICDSSRATVRLYRLTVAFSPSLVPYARDLDQIVAESEDAGDGPRAFREERKPVWKMR